jgi:hypothetical protein
MALCWRILLKVVAVKKIILHVHESSKAASSKRKKDRPLSLV